MVNMHNWTNACRRCVRRTFEWTLSADRSVRAAQTLWSTRAASLQTWGAAGTVDEACKHDPNTSNFDLRVTPK